MVLGCCAILIFTLSIAIASAKNDFTTITNIYEKQISIKENKLSQKTTNTQRNAL